MWEMGHDNVLTLKKLRSIEPDETKNISDEELKKIRQSFYDFGQLIFEDWVEERFGSNYPLGSLTDYKDNHNIKP